VNNWKWVAEASQQHCWSNVPDATSDQRHPKRDAKQVQLTEFSMSKPALLITAKMMPMIEAQVAEHFEVHRCLSDADDAVLSSVGQNIVAMCTGGHGKVKSNEALFARLPNLKVISSFGVGYDAIEIAAAAKRGIVVTNTPDVLNEEVADTALGLLLMTVRELGRAEQYLRAGHWAHSGDFRLTSSLRERKVGMVGFGRIGKAIARRVQAFGVPVAYFGRTKQDEAIPYYSDLAAMARDYNTLICITPGGAGTKDLINANVLQALGPKGIVINVARGTVVDETALIAALKAKTIHAAGLDVMWGEPKINPELMTLDNCVLLPHVGSGSFNTRDAMGQRVVDNLKAFVSKTSPLSPVAETPFKGWV
jgi:lactate dehydrogenase-like 2-hydroxyacid dehydrogenase